MTEPHQFLHFKNSVAAMDAVTDGTIPVVEAMGLVKLLRSEERCDVDAFLSGKRLVLTCRIAPIMVGNVHTGQLVRLGDDYGSGRDIVGPLSASYHIVERRFFSPTELARADALLANQHRPSQFQWLHARLDTPSKRAGAVIAAISALILLIWAIAAVHEYGAQDAFENWIEAVLQDSRAYRRHATAAWATYALVAGLLCSYWQDQTVGRLYRWIKHGRIDRNRPTPPRSR